MGAGTSLAGNHGGMYGAVDLLPEDISRLVDRAIRPLFPDDYHAETQVNIQLMSGDENALPDALAAFAASSALAVSDIPFNGPISEVRVARVGAFSKAHWRLNTV